LRTIARLFKAVLISGFALTLFGQDFKINPRYSCHTGKDQAELLLVVPDEKVGKSISLSNRLDFRIVLNSDTIASARVVHLFIPMAGIDIGNHPLTAVVTRSGELTELKSELVVLLPKPNGVRIDRLTGKLIVNGLPWFPFGFYCYSPVQSSLAEEEAVKGFNLMSPYQNIDPRTIRDREIYMDRCARMGMKVHYQLTYLARVRGATGIQYFIRQGLNGFPKKVEVEGSVEGKSFTILASANNQVDERARGSIRKDFTMEFNQLPLR
jgi:hypothetical protein